VKEVEPPAPGAALQRSVAACIASILEVEAVEVPVPEDGHPDPWIVWRNWLLQRGLGLVPIGEPAQFNWPGPWVAVLRSADGLVGAVAFGAPPGLAWKPLGGPEAFEDVAFGYLIAPADVAVWEPAEHAVASGAGTVEALVVAAEAEAAPVTVERAVARAGRGLEGDRYFDGRGTFSNRYGRGHDLTLVEAEVLDALGLLSPEEARRNVVTRGIDLNALVGRRFRVGGVECEGVELCEPCNGLAKLTERGVLRGLVHRGGLRADILQDGVVRVGDAIRAVAD